MFWSITIVPFFVAEQYTIDIFTMQFMHALADGHSDFFSFLVITSEAATNNQVQVSACIHISIHQLISRQLNIQTGPSENIWDSLCSLSHHWHSVLISFSLTQRFFWIHLSSLCLCHSLKTINEVSWDDHSTHLFCFLNERISVLSLCDV